MELSHHYSDHRYRRFRSQGWCRRFPMVMTASEQDPTESAQTGSSSPARSLASLIVSRMEAKKEFTVEFHTPGSWTERPVRTERNRELSSRLGVDCGLAPGCPDIDTHKAHIASPVREGAESLIPSLSMILTICSYTASWAFGTEASLYSSYGCLISVAMLILVYTMPE